MTEALSCVFSPGPCLTSFADTLLSLFPFGLYGVVFLAGMIVGERIGLWGIIAAVLIWVGARFATKKAPDLHEHVAGPDATPPVPKKKRKTLF